MIWCHISEGPGSRDRGARHDHALFVEKAFDKKRKLMTEQLDQPWKWESKKTNVMPNVFWPTDKQWCLPPQLIKNSPQINQDGPQTDQKWISRGQMSDESWGASPPRPPDLAGGQAPQTPQHQRVAPMRNIFEMINDKWVSELWDSGDSGTLGTLGVRTSSKSCSDPNYGVCLDLLETYW